MELVPEIWPALLLPLTVPLLACTTVVLYRLCLYGLWPVLHNLNHCIVPQALFGAPRADGAGP